MDLDSNKIKLIIVIPLALIAAGLILPWVTMFVGSLFLPDPAKPTVRSGEFPFKLAYKINDEMFTVEDTVICRYIGIGMDTGRGKYIKWEVQLKSNKKDHVVLLSTNDSEVIYPLGRAEYYMGEDFKENYLYPNALVISNNGSNTRLITAVDLKEQYGIELISWEPSPPIENTFK